MVGRAKQIVDEWGIGRTEPEIVIDQRAGIEEDKRP